MKFPLHFSARLIGFMVLLGSAHAAADWTQLKVGMSSAETSRILGQPLLRYHLAVLKAAGVSAVGINTHHPGNALRGVKATASAISVSPATD